MIYVILILLSGYVLFRHIILIRHGQYNLNGNGDKEKYLTELGREQVTNILKFSQYSFVECGSSEFESGVVCASLCLAAGLKILIYYLYSNPDLEFPDSFGPGSVSEDLKNRVLHHMLF
jgi:hypothetical protein